MSISNILFQLRYERGLSQKELAEAIGVSQSTIAKIEVNRNEATASTIRKLAKYFNVSTDYLLELEDDFGVKVSDRSDTPTTSEEEKLLKDYRSLPEELRALIREQIAVFTKADLVSGKKIK